MTELRLYFSFRSPYSWLAHHRIACCSELAWEVIDAIPVYPPDEQTMAALTPGKTKLGYLREDVERITKAYGLSVQWPRHGDPDWARPHAAFLWAQAELRGQPFASALYEARFQRGEDLGDDAVLRAAAERAGLDPELAVGAATDPTWRAALGRGFERMREDRVFGVPTFVYRGERFWGNDRIEWLLRAMRVAREERVLDLRRDPLLAPHGAYGR